MNHECGWIYIGAFAENLNMFKVGFSTISQMARFKQTTTSPDYVPFRYYKVPISELRKLERYLHKELEQHFTRAKHLLTGMVSECFYGSPVAAAKIIEYELTKCLDLITTPEGYDLTDVVFLPDYEQFVFSGGWSDRHQDFLNLFFDEGGNRLPFKTFRDWGDF